MTPYKFDPPTVDQRALLLRILRDLGVKDPKRFLR